MRAFIDFIKFSCAVVKAYRLSKGLDGCYFTARTFGGRTCAIMVAFQGDAITVIDKLTDMSALTPVDPETLKPVKTNA